MSKIISPATIMEPTADYRRFLIYLYDTCVGERVARTAEEAIEQYLREHGGPDYGLFAEDKGPAEAKGPRADSP